MTRKGTGNSVAFFPLNEYITHFVNEPFVGPRKGGTIGEEDLIILNTLPGK